MLVDYDIQLQHNFRDVLSRQLKQNTIDWAISICSSQFRRLEAQSGYRPIQFLVRTLLLGGRQPPSYCVLTLWRNHLSLVIRALIPFLKAPPWWLNHLLKTPPPNTIRGLEMRMFGGKWTFIPFRGGRKQLKKIPTLARLFLTVFSPHFWK
jgi:hypothetical protein